MPAPGPLCTSSLGRDAPAPICQRLATRRKRPFEQPHHNESRFAPMTDQPVLTLPQLAHESGVTEWQLRGAVESGAVKPAATAGRTFLFTPEQVAELREAARLVAYGVGLAVAIKIIRDGWSQMMSAA